MQRNEFHKKKSKKNAILLFTLLRFLQIVIISLCLEIIKGKIILFKMKKIAIFASGSGTNAQRIIEYFSGNNSVQISIVLSNRKDAFVLERAKNLNVANLYFTKDQLYTNGFVLDLLLELHIDLIVLAGFLWFVPAEILRAFPRKIINIHPALLPKYGGRGMYGLKVHEAVKQNHDNESGITIHYVNEKYDEGETIFQAVCPVIPQDNAEDIADKVHLLEYRYYPEIIEKILEQNQND